MTELGQQLADVTAPSPHGLAAVAVAVQEGVAATISAVAQSRARSPSIFDVSSAQSLASNTSTTSSSTAVQGASELQIDRVLLSALLVAVLVWMVWSAANDSVNTDVNQITTSTEMSRGVYLSGLTY